MIRTKSKARDRRALGQTKDVGFVIGVRRTLSIPLEVAWQLLTSAEGVRLWLGPGRGIKFEKGETYVLRDGSSGEVRVFHPEQHLRITCQPEGWERPSTIQIRVIPSGHRTTIAFHQEHLPDAKAREQRRAHYEAVLDAIEELLPNDAGLQTDSV